MINYLTTAVRSAFLSALENGGKGVRKGIERVQSSKAALMSGYDLATFTRTKLEAFQQSPETESAEGKLALALVVKDSPWSEEQPYTVDLFLPIAGSDEVEWIGFVPGKVVAVNEGEVVGGLYTVTSELIDGTSVKYEFDPAARWFFPTAAAAIMTMPQSRGQFVRIAA